MRQLDDLKLSEQFTLWRYWECIAYKHFGERRRPDPPNCELDTWTVFLSSVCLWFGGGVALKLCAIYVDSSLDEMLDLYVNIGWFVVLFLNMTASMIMSDPHRRHTVEQITVIRKYHLSLAKLSERFDVDLSMFRYEQYDNETVEPTPPPRRPPPPKPIPSRAPRQMETAEVINHHKVTPREVGLPGELVTPASITRMITQAVIEQHPNPAPGIPKLARRLEGKRQELIYRLHETPTKSRQELMYNYHASEKSLDS